MTSPSIRAYLVVGIVASAFLSQAQAGEIKVSGVGVAITTAQEQTALPDGRSLVRLHQKGVLIDDGTPGPLDHNEQNCDGFVVISADGKHAPGSGFCDYIDKDGDRWAMWWATADDVNKWGVVWGTGKFAGMTGGGGTTEINPYPDADLFRYEGTLILK